MARFLAVALFFLFQPWTALAEHTQTSKVRYEKQFGKSDWYEVDVHFYTGQELNKATKSLDYQTFEKYAVVFWGEGQATIIEIDTFSVCGSKFTSSCLNPAGKMEGADQEGRAWEICTAHYCL